jgi:hypothetical protein
MDGRCGRRRRALETGLGAKECGGNEEQGT